MSVSRAVSGGVVTILGWLLAGMWSPAALAGEPSLAFPGYSGYLNVPSATVLDRGQVEMQWSDQAYVDGRYDYKRNFTGAVGVFPDVEVGGRVVWDQTQSNCFQTNCGIRDLSANLKVRAPLIPKNWFTLAAGVQDLGGAANTFGAKYVVAGRAFGPFEVSAGYGVTDVSPRYLDGAFGGIDFQPVDWFSLMVEHDSRDARFGIGLGTPSGWLPGGARIKGKLLVHDAGDAATGRTFASVGISIPLGASSHPRRLPRASASAPVTRGPALSSRDTSKASPATTTGDGTTPAPSENPGNGRAVARRVGRALVQAGYDRVRVADVGPVLYVRWENNLYNRDERDSIRDVAHRVRSLDDVHERARLELLNQNIPVAYRVVPLDKGALRVTESGFSSPDFLAPPPKWDFEGGYGPAWKPRVTFGPAISSSIATEYGVWDASVALSTEVSSSLWTGALASATYNTNVYNTTDFEQGGAFYDHRKRTALWEAELQQTLKLYPLLYTTAHVGRYQRQLQGVFNETELLSPNGRHSLGFVGGAFEYRPVPGSDIRQALGRYRYYNPGLDTELTVYGGEFLAGDRGVRVEGRFWFGDYAVTLTYKNTDAQFIGLGWVIPLSPRKDHSFRYAQFRGDVDWHYSVQTRINESRNVISFGGARLIRSANPIDSLYLNRGRLTR